MFVVSQYILNFSGMCTTSQQITTYSIALGLILYGSIYLYILFYNNEYLNIFNKFIIYIVGVDLLLSMFYYYNLQSSDKLIKQDDLDNESEEDDDPEYEETDDETEPDTDKEDEEAQQYIQNLIKQANLSTQPLVNISNQEQIPLLVEQPNQEQKPLALQQEPRSPQNIPVFNTVEKEELDELEEMEQTEQTEMETNADVDIDNIIEEVSSKKKGGRKSKKTQAIVV